MFSIDLQLVTKLGLVTASLILLFVLAEIEPIACSPVEGKLQIKQPVNNSTYRNLLYIDFKVDWSVHEIIIPWIAASYHYIIDDDNKTATTITLPNTSDNLNSIHFARFPGTATDSVSYVANISSLSNGQHKLTIYSDGIANYDNFYLVDFNCSFPSVYFFVDNPTPTPSPSPTEKPIPTAAQLFGEKDVLLLGVIFIIIFAIIVTALRLHYKRRQKENK